MIAPIATIATIALLLGQGRGRAAAESAGRGFICWGAKSGLLFSKDPYHNTDCDHLNAKAGSGWICNGQVGPSSSGSPWGGGGLGVGRTAETSNG